MNTLETRVQKTIAYLNSERGQKNWSLNVGRGYTVDMNIVAAVQTATRLITYEKIDSVIKELDRLFDFVSWTLHRRWCNLQNPYGGNK